MVIKIFENFANNCLVDHLEICDLFSDFQYGFSSSVLTANLHTVVSDRISRAFNRTGAAKPVILDIFKDFVRLSNAGLLHKLKCYRISGPVFILIFSLYYLMYKRHWVVLDVKSLQEYPTSSGLPRLQEYRVNYGVLQGSVLMSTLFLLCINDLTDDGSVIWLSILMMLLSTLNAIRNLIYGSK